MKYNIEEFQTITKTDITKKVYLDRAEQLMTRAKKHFSLKNTEVIDIRQLVIWLIDLKPTIARSTWRQYKSSIVYFLETHPDELAATEALEKLRFETSKGSLKYTEKTSSLKLKKITFDDWKKINSYLLIKKRKWYPELISWLRSSIITGLRPIEWHNAVLFQHTEGLALKIKNAKNTNGRAHGADRTLLLKNINDEDLNHIKTHINNVKTFKGMNEYAYFYQGCSIALYKACRQCWPRRKKHITLYSTRHQFSANAKSSGFSKPEVAAMMGHAIDLTATIHYGRKLAGNEQLGINPLDDDVSRVKISQNTSPNKKQNAAILSDLLGNSNPLPNKDK